LWAKAVCFDISGFYLCVIIKVDNYPQVFKELEFFIDATVLNSFVLHTTFVRFSSNGVKLRVLKVKKYP
jgi:hypothetical protein